MPEIGLVVSGLPSWFEYALWGLLSHHRCGYLVSLQIPIRRCT